MSEFPFVLVAGANHFSTGPRLRWDDRRDGDDRRYDRERKRHTAHDSTLKLAVEGCHSDMVECTEESLSLTPYR